MTDPASRIREHLTFLYGAQQAGAVWAELASVLDEFRSRRPDPTPGDRPAARGLDQTDAILISYADQISEPDRPPLFTLGRFLRRYLTGLVSGVHLLPFFPYSSDDGFSVTDFRGVDPRVGSWEDVHRLGREWRLMFDLVANHISRHSDWFRGFLRGETPYRDYFLVAEPESAADWVPLVTRPRALPLLTPVETSRGTQHVWTTFSDDQIDLNYANPRVMLEMVEVLLFYVAHGAELVRLDAVAFLWKEPGTNCMHLPQTHAVVKLFRAVLDAVAPHVILVTETNVPHPDNVTYFGEPLAPSGSTDEAQMVYQFPLPPLVLHSLLTGSAERLTGWLASLAPPPGAATFFNFTASHDGIGVVPARGILSEAEIQQMVGATLARGGRVSCKTNPDGSQSVYELNVSYLSALSDPEAPDPERAQIDRFLVSQAIMLALAGVPGIYVHSLLGSRNWEEGVEKTGRNRAINRQRFDWAELEAELARPTSVRHQVLAGYSHLLRQRAAHPAFHPQGEQTVIDGGATCFALLRTAPHGSQRVLCIHNVSGQEQRCRMPVPAVRAGARDLLTGTLFRGRGRLDLTLRPYQILWLWLDPRGLD